MHYNDILFLIWPNFWKVGFIPCDNYMCVLLGKGFGKDSKVLRPIIIQCPVVRALKRLKSSGKCQIKSLSLPSSLFWPAAAIIVIISFVQVMMVLIFFLVYTKNKALLMWYLRVKIPNFKYLSYLFFTRFNLSYILIFFQFHRPLLDF